jgi:hypothetical protein
VLLALFVHSLLYAGFFEDPLTWGVLGIAAALRPRPSPGRPSKGGDAAPGAPRLLAH